MTDTTVQLDHDTFFRAFLSPPHMSFRPGRRVSANLFAGLKSANDLPETEIMRHFVTVVRSHHLTPGSTLATVSFDPLSMGHEADVKIQAAFCCSSDVRKRGQVHWTDSRVPVRFSGYIAGADPFRETKIDDCWTEAGRERERLRGHVDTAAGLLFAAQQRTFMFMIFIMGKRFRLLRWDRAGVIATPSVDYVENPALLCDCLRRLSLLDDLSLGFDPTATRLRTHDPDFLRMDAAALDDPNDVDHTERRLEEGEIADSFVFGYVRSRFRDSLSSADWPRYRLRVPHGDNARDYLVGKPQHFPSGAISRGTLGYVALDCATQRFVWLKDVWCMPDLIVEREGDILGKLNAAGIANVPTLICHGNVQDQVTVTEEWWHITRGTRPDPFSQAGQRTSPGSRKRKRDCGPSGEDSLCNAPEQAPPATGRQPECPLQRHIHYRIAVKEVAIPFVNFRCGKQLATLALDCLNAHHQAATNPETSLFHRDISNGNMLIYPRVRPDEDGGGQSMCWTGLLTDWELAKPVDTQETLKSLVEGHRVGTHFFMSVHLLSSPLGQVKIPDELESFFHVLVYYAVRYLRSNCTYPKGWINGYFLTSEQVYYNIYLGGMKSTAIERDGQLKTVCEWAYHPLRFNSPMDELLGELIKSFTAHYKVTAYEFERSFSPGFSSSSSSAASSDAGSQEAAPRQPKVHVVLPSLEDDPELAQDMEELKLYKPPDRTPTAEDRELARRVADHDFALNFIADLLRRSEWPDDDCIPARAAPAPPLEPQAEPEPEPEPASVDAAPAPKRRRKAAPKAKEKATRSAAQPARPPSTTRQTRSQTRAASSKTRPRGRRS